MSTATLARTRAARLSAPASRELVGAYGRISRVDRRNDGRGAALGIGRQAGDCDDYVAEQLPGLSVEHHDDNASGWTADVNRPGWTDLLDGILAGRYRAVVAWHADRFTRQASQLLSLVDACESTGTELHTVTGGHMRDRTLLEIQGVLASAESRQKSRRIARKHKELAMAGKPSGGRRAWGRNPDMSVREDEAVLIRDVAGRILNGESLASCARLLNDAGHTGPSGAAFTGSNLGLLLLRPHMAALRTHHGEVVAEATWPPIMDRATYDALALKLGDPKRRTSFTTARKYLLAGLARCGVCGEQVRGRSGGARTTAPAYACYSCGKAQRRVDEVDRLATLYVVKRLAMLDASGLLADTSLNEELAGLTAALADVRERREDTMRAYARGTVTADERDMFMPMFRDEQANLEAALVAARERAAAPVRALDGLTGPSPETAFDALPLGRQRTVVDLLCTVTIHPSGRRGVPVDEVVKIEPREVVTDLA